MGSKACTGALASTVCSHLWYSKDILGRRLKLLRTVVAELLGRLGRKADIAQVRRKLYLFSGARETSKGGFVVLVTGS